MHICSKTSKNMWIWTANKTLVCFFLQSFNILRYQLGQKYDSHYDAFNPAEYGPQKSQRVSKQPNLVFLLRVLKGRFKTTICWSSTQHMNAAHHFAIVLIECRRRWRDDVPIRGRSLFLSFGLIWFGFSDCKGLVLGKQNGKNMNGSYDYEKCIGLKVMPRQGDAIFFYNLFPNGTIDQVCVSDNQKAH